VKKEGGCLKRKPQVLRLITTEVSITGEGSAAALRNFRICRYGDWKKVIQTRVTRSYSSKVSSGTRERNLEQRGVKGMASPFLGQVGKKKAVALRKRKMLKVPFGD